MQKLTLFILSLFVSIVISAQMLISEESVVLKTSKGDIFGTLRVPSVGEKAVPVVLLIAGSGPTDRNGNNPQMQNNSLKMLAEGLFRNGIASLVFDKRGIAESADSMKSEADLRFEDYINDLRAWINQLAEDKRFSEIIVAGHSEGALIGLVASVNNPKVSKYTSIAGVGVPAGEILREQLTTQLATQPTSVKEMIFGYIDTLEKGETVANVPQSLYALFRPSVQPYMISWFKYNPQTEIAQLKIPVLIVQGTTDIQVSIEQTELLATAQPNAQKVIIENMNHVLKDCAEMDVAKQMATYTNPNLPINKELVNVIVSFVKK